MRSAAPPGSPHGSDIPLEQSGGAQPRPGVPFPSKELLRQDRENRDFINNLGFAVSVLEDMIAKFETTTRAKLAELNTKAARLERLLTYVEFAVSGGAPVDAELPFPIQPASPVASVQANLSASNSPVVGAAGDSSSARRGFENADLAPRDNAGSPSKSSMSPRQSRVVADQNRPSAKHDHAALPKSPKQGPGSQARSPSPMAGRHRLVDDDRLSHSTGRHSSRSGSRKRGETDDVQESFSDQQKLDRRGSPQTVRESYTVNSSFQDWRPPAAQVSEAAQVELRASRKDELVNMDSDEEEDDSEVTQVVRSSPPIPLDDAVSPRLIHQWHRTMDNALYESLALTNSMQASTPSTESHGLSREATPQSAVLYSPLAGRSPLSNVSSAANAATRPVGSPSVQPKQLFAGQEPEDEHPQATLMNQQAESKYQQAVYGEQHRAGPESQRAASVEYFQAAPNDQQAGSMENYQGTPSDQQAALAEYDQAGREYQQAVGYYQAAADYSRIAANKYHDEVSAGYHGTGYTDRDPAGLIQEVVQSSPSVKDLQQGFASHAAARGHNDAAVASSEQAEGHGHVARFSNDPSYMGGSYDSMPAGAQTLYAPSRSDIDEHTQDVGGEVSSFEHNSQPWKPELEQVVEEHSDSEGHSKQPGPFEEQDHTSFGVPFSFEYQKPPIPRPMGILASWRPPVFHPSPASTSRHVDFANANDPTAVPESSEGRNLSHETASNEHFDGSPLASQSSPIDPEGQSIPDVDTISPCHTPASCDHSHQGAARRDEDAMSDYEFMLPLPHFLDSSPPPPSRASTGNSIWDQMGNDSQASGSRRSGLPPMRAGESHRVGNLGSGKAEQYLHEHLQRLIEQEYASTVDESWADSESLPSPAPRVRMPLTASQGG